MGFPKLLLCIISADLIALSSSPSAKTIFLPTLETLSDTICSILAVGLSLLASCFLYKLRFFIGFKDTPLSIAAFATAEDTSTINLGSNGAGII